MGPHFTVTPERGLPCLSSRDAYDHVWLALHPLGAQSPPSRTPACRRIGSGHLIDETFSANRSRASGVRARVRRQVDLSPWCHLVNSRGPSPGEAAWPAGAWFWAVLLGGDSPPCHHIRLHTLPKQPDPGSLAPQGQIRFWRLAVVTHARSFLNTTARRCPRCDQAHGGLTDVNEPVWRREGFLPRAPAYFSWESESASDHLLLCSSTPANGHSCFLPWFSPFPIISACVLFAFGIFFFAVKSERWELCRVELFTDLTQNSRIWFKTFLSFTNKVIGACLIESRTHSPRRRPECCRPKPCSSLFSPCSWSQLTSKVTLLGKWGGLLWKMKDAEIK